MHRIVIGIGILATWLTGAASASAQGCDPLKPAWPVDKEIRNVTEANVNILLRSLGSGDIRNEYHRIERTQKFNNPDDVHRWNSFIYMLCTLLERSSLSDDEKIEYYFTLVRMSQQGPLEPTREGDALRTPLSNPTPAVIFQDTFETDKARMGYGR